MSWLGLRHKGVEVLYPDEWNRVVDGLDLLKQYVDEKVGVVDLENLSSDIKPSADNKYTLGDNEREWKAIYAHYGYFSDNAYVNGRRVLKDGDPVTVYYFEGPAKEEIDSIKTASAQPTSLETLVIDVGSAPTPLSTVSKLIKRLHVKVPRNSPSIVYLGASDRQDYVLEPGDIDVLEIDDASKVYVRSLGNAKIFILLER